jgi:hypothetical protein
MQLLLEIENPNKLALLTALLEELRFVNKIQVLDKKTQFASILPKRTREESLARIMKGCDLASFGDGGISKKC